MLVFDHNFDYIMDGSFQLNLSIPKLFIYLIS